MLTTQQEQLNNFIQDMDDEKRRPATKQRYIQWITRLGASIPKPFDEITQDELVEWMRSQTQLKSIYSQNTVRSTISVFYKNYLKQPEKVTHPVFKVLPTLISKPDLPTWEELKRMVHVAGHPRDRALIGVLAEAGMRVGALSGPFPKGSYGHNPPYVCIGDVIPDTPGCRLLIRKLKKKNGVEREVRILYFAGALKHWLIVHPDSTNKNAPLFCALKGELQPLSYNRIWAIIKRVAKRAGITKNIHPHLFRKAFATRLKEKGMDPWDIAQMGGWVPQSKVLLRYIQQEDTTAWDRYESAARGQPVTEPSTKIEKPMQMCSSCGEALRAEANWCDRCGQVTDVEIAKVLEARKADDMQFAADLQQLRGVQRRQAEQEKRTAQDLKDQTEEIQRLRQMLAHQMDQALEQHWTTLVPVLEAMLSGDREQMKQAITTGKQALRSIRDGREEEAEDGEGK